jgi:ribosomal protein S21
MPGRVYVEEGESLRSAAQRLRRVVKQSGVLIGYISLRDRNRRKDYYEKPSVKRRRKRLLAEARRRRGRVRTGE